MFPFFSLLSLLSLFLPSISSSPTPISLSLHPIPEAPSQDPLQRLTHLTRASLTRARHLKKPPISQNPSNSKTPLFPHAYGGYSISLNFGTPPQTSSLIMDTGSQLVWIPCTKSYTCKNCSFISQPTLQNPPFLPKSSSSSKIIGCSNPKCRWLYGSDFLHSKCPDCNPTNCSQICPPYSILYGSGSTAGILLSETLVFPERRVENFGVGCSLLSTRQPAGIAGFGRGPSSLPSQLGLTRFAYCLLSHSYDDTTNFSSLVLDDATTRRTADSGEKGLQHTPFLKNPAAGNPSFSVYYYVGLRKVTVGGKDVGIPYRFLHPGSDGNGGTIVDSGTTFTFMEGHVFEPVAREFESQLGLLYKRETDTESRTGLRPCYKVPGDKSFLSPKLVFHFKGGADMELAVSNYFAFLGETDTVCLTIVTDVGELSEGPSIILGNFQQQNFYMEYDLKKERMGFRRQLC
ncbi:hypothetical protein AAC387_Pa05g0898 [Persea americana]